MKTFQLHIGKIDHILALDGGKPTKDSEVGV